MAAAASRASLMYVLTLGEVGSRTKIHRPSPEPLKPPPPLAVLHVPLAPCWVGGPPEITAHVYGLEDVATTQ